MSNEYFLTLLAMKAIFEGEEDWVAVGHIDYLLDRLFDNFRPKQGGITSFSQSLTRH
jgi:hypothetical protein